MKRLLILAILAVSTCIVAIAQTSMTPQMQNAPARKSPLAEYAGSWIGTFEGHTWITLRLVHQGNQITGTVQRAHDFKFNNNGGLQSVSQEQITEGIDSAAIQGDGLLLTAKDPGAQETSRYVLRLTSANTADLKMVGMSMPPGMPKPLPWNLSRVTANAVSPVR
jgi:hypothetical protein